MEPYLIPFTPNGMMFNKLITLIPNMIAAERKQATEILTNATTVEEFALAWRSTFYGYGFVCLFKYDSVVLFFSILFRHASNQHPRTRFSSALKEIIYGLILTLIKSQQRVHDEIMIKSACRI
jgi:hypothetical protein